ncbi:MAG: hypothetical protein KDI55_20575 [Anaerolineae bacterium]|nr:hypothetical protein [Anaerolineae bacterium]
MGNQLDIFHRLAIRLLPEVRLCRKSRTSRSFLTFDFFGKVEGLLLVGNTHLAPRLTIPVSRFPFHAR